MTKINWALQPVCAWCGLESVNRDKATEHAQNCDKSPLVRRILALEKRIEDLYTGDSGAECIVCERITANGTCTECRHGTSPLKLALARAEKAEAELKVARVDAATKQREACARQLEGEHRINGGNCCDRANAQVQGTVIDSFGSTCGNCTRADMVRSTALVE